MFEFLGYIIILLFNPSFLVLYYIIYKIYKRKSTYKRKSIKSSDDDE